MATYPEGNPGAYPIDPLTPVGQFRLSSGDIKSVAYSPAEPGFQDYTNYSDDEITAFLTQGGDSIARAIGWSLMQQALSASAESKSVSDYDLKVDLTKRAEDLRKTAQMYFNLADDQDAASGEGDSFDITEVDYPGWLRPETTARPYLGGLWP